MLTRNLSNMSDEKAEEFIIRMRDLVEEFIDADTRDPNDQTFAVTVAMYPSFYFRDLTKEK